MLIVSICPVAWLAESFLYDEVIYFLTSSECNDSVLSAKRSAVPVPISHFPASLLLIALFAENPQVS